MGRDATPRGMRRRVRAGDALRIGGEVWRIGVWPCGAQLTAESTGDVVRARVRHGGYPCGEGVVWCQDVGRGDGARIELWCHAPDDVVIEHIKAGGDRMDWMKASVVSGGETIGVVRVPVLGVPRAGDWVSVGGQAHRIVRVEHGDMCVVLDVTPDASAAAVFSARVTKGEG